MSTTLREVRLYGVLGEAFGRVHRFDVHTPAEALRALRANCGRRWDQLMYRMRNAPFRVQIGEDYADQKRMEQPIGRECILIIPVVTGAAKSPVWGILIGVALIVLSGPIGGALTAGAGAGGTFLGLTAAQVAGAAVAMGISLALGGVMQLLMQPPKPSSVEDANNMPSYAFDGPRNTIGQGNPVPVFYGHLIIGSQAVSVGLFAEAVFIPPPRPFSMWNVPQGNPWNKP